MEISRRIGIIFGRHSGIFPGSREKVNNGPLILTCHNQAGEKVPIYGVLTLSESPDKIYDTGIYLGILEVGVTS